MKSAWMFLIGGVCGAAIALLPRAAVHLHAAAHAIRGSQAPVGAERAHTEEKFIFIVHAPMEQAAPLFGADKERVWAPGWDPQFIHPLPATDAEGMVFTVAHDHLKSVWVNTELNLKAGRVQYVYVIPDMLVTVITLRLKSEDNQTRVEVQYDRTALNPEADAHVQHLAKGDRNAGPEWEGQINEYLEKRQGSGKNL